MSSAGKLCQGVKGMAVEFKVHKDEWTPTLLELKKKFMADELKDFFGDLGQRIVSTIKKDMSRSRGFKDGVPYKKLIIEWRYHGRKRLMASKKNLLRQIQGTAIETEVVKGKKRKVVTVADKTKVTPDTKPLIDLGDLWKSWDVLKHSATGLLVGNKTPMEKEKAFYNDDRGRWDWGRTSINDVFDRFVRYIDKEIFD